MSRESKWHRFLSRLFGLGHHGDETVTIADDIIDQYEYLVETRGRFAASFRTCRQIVGSIYGLLFGYAIWRLSMLKNYFKIGWRNLKRNRIYTIINLLGLSIAVAWSVLVFCFVRDEFTFDRFHEDIDRLALIGTTDRQYNYSFTPHAPLGPALVTDSPEIVEAARVVDKDGLVKLGNTMIRASFVGTDPDFFTLFTFPLKWGASETFARRRRSIILSDEMSQKIFGQVNPVGRTISIKFETEFQDFEVVGVFQPLPEASSLTFDGVVSIDHFLKEGVNNWKEKSELFIKITAESEMDDVIARFDEITRPYLDALPRGEHLTYQLFPFARYHLYNTVIYYSSLEQPSSLNSSWILISIAVLILLLASMNYINLAVASMMHRVKEIGLRKIMGAVRWQIIQQLMGEACIFILIALGAGIILARFALPPFQTLTGKTVSFVSLTKPDIWMFLILLLILMGGLVAVYPALLLSRMESSKILQSRYRMTGRNLFSRGLIVFQFAISVFLICVTFIISRQHHYMLSRHFGSNLSQVMRINLAYSVKPEYLSQERILDFKTKIESLPGVTDVTCTSARLAGHANSVTDHDGQRHIVFSNEVDAHFFRTLGLRLNQGSLSEADFNRHALIVSEQFVKKFIQGDPIGQTLEKVRRTSYQNIPIAGVVEDFNVLSLRRAVNPQIIKIDTDAEFGFLYVRFQGESMQEATASIKNLYLDLWPDTLFDFAFISDNVAQIYSQEARWSKIVRNSAAVALFIACSGLFGLTLLVIVRRNKEMSIRQVLGASPLQVMKLVQRDFIGLVLLGNCLACPGAFFVMRRWLSDFTHRTQLSWWIFACSALIAFIIAALTVGLQSMNTIRTNPAKHLRVE